MRYKRFLFYFTALFSIYVIYGTFIKQTRFLPAKLKEAFVHLEGTPKKIEIPGHFIIATNPGAVKVEDGFLLVYRAECTSLIDYVKKHLTFNRNKKIGQCLLDQDLNVISTPVYLTDTAPGIKASKQSPNDPRLIQFKDKYYTFYNDRVRSEGEKGYVRQVYMCEVTRDGFGTAKRLSFSDGPGFTEKGRKFRNIEKNWSPFVYEDDLYLVYLIEPHVILKLDIASGRCELVEENQSKKVWEFGLPRGGTPCIKDQDRYISLFHAPYHVFCLGHSHSNAYIMGAYSFSAKPPFEITGMTKNPLSGEAFYTGLRKFIFPTGLVDDKEDLFIFYGKDDKEMWSLKIPKERLYKEIQKL